MVYILLGSDDYVARQILGVYNNRADAEQDVKDEIFEKRDANGKIALISRQGKPHYEIKEMTVKP